ncbi:MAG TPA: hypothetical protein VN924_03830 [Bryobacteraceae bacterium]|nr:hypothetical protein [Bryobacteraceae bacterium]
MEVQMLPEPGERSRLTAYLLNRLPESEVREVEERYFADDAFFVLAGACEQELIRDYLLKRLSPDDARSFERKYLSLPGLREKVEFCAAIMTVTGSLPAPVRANAGPRARNWRLAAAAAILAGFVFIAWQQTRIARIDARLRQTIARDAITVAKSAPSPVIPSFALRPALDRDVRSDPVALRIAPEAENVRLTLEIEPGGEAPRYRAALTLPGGAEIWSEFVPGGSQTVAVTLPARNIPRGDYVLTLDARAGPAHEAYSFRVERE